MTIAYWCVLAAAFIPLLFVGYAKFTGGRYNNYKPREFLAKLEGPQARARDAQLNSYEAFPPFAAAVIIAHQLAAPQSQIDLLALGWVGLRLFYGVCYIANWAMLRSTVWLLAVGCVVGLFVIAA